MQRSSLLRSWPGKAVIFAVYFVFFAVQVNLRYAFSQVVYNKDIVPHHQTGSSKNKQVDEQNDHLPQAKLNKRFYPQAIQAIPLLSVAAPVCYVAHEDIVLTETPALPGMSLLTRFRRGPPVDC